MPFGMCNASATFQRAIARALQRIVNRKESMVMAYIDDIVIATETLEDNMDRLREVFQCLREAGFKMRVSKCDFMRTEFKYLGRVVSADGIQLDPKDVSKLRDWDIPQPKLSFKVSPNTIVTSSLGTQSLWIRCMQSLALDLPFRGGRSSNKPSTA